MRVRVWVGWFAAGLAVMSLQGDGGAEEGGDALAALPLQAARVLAGDGFERRAALWEDVVEASSGKSLPVFLYAENEYCFLLAADVEGAEVSLCDEGGEVVATGEPVGDGGVQFLFVRPEEGGRYVLRVRNPGGGEMGVAVTYCYK